MSGISIRTILHWMYPCVLIHFLLRWLDWGFMVATWLYTMSSMSAPSSLEQAGCILLTSQVSIPFTVNPEASIRSCAIQSAWLCHRFIVNARLDQKWGPGASAICKVLCFVSSAMHVTVTVPDILTPCTKTLQVSQRLYISARLCISIYFIHIYPY